MCIMCINNEHLYTPRIIFVRNVMALKCWQGGLNAPSHGSLILC